MTKKSLIMGLLLIAGLGAAAHADIFLRDATYEQELKFEASADQTITPAKVLRWMSSLLGHTDYSAPSNTEFQPIVNAHNGQVRVIAAIAYKF